MELKQPYCESCGARLSMCSTFLGMICENVNGCLEIIVGDWYEYELSEDELKIVRERLRNGNQEHAEETTSGG